MLWYGLFVLVYGQDSALRSRCSCMGTIHPKPSHIHPTKDGKSGILQVISMDCWRAFFTALFWSLVNVLESKITGKSMENSGFTPQKDSFPQMSIPYVSLRTGTSLHVFPSKKTFLEIVPGVLERMGSEKLCKSAKFGDRNPSRTMAIDEKQEDSPLFIQYMIHYKQILIYIYIMIHIHIYMSQRIHVWNIYLHWPLK